MKKWIIIAIAAAILFNVGWRFFVNYMYEHKGVPKSHIIGYLIYRDKYLPGRSIVTMKGDKQLQAQEAQKKPEVQKKAVKLKTPETIKNEYDEKLKKVSTNAEKIDAKTIYYQEMMKAEKNPAKKKEWRTKFIEISAKTYAKNNTDIKYEGKMNEYRGVQKKIANYRKNDVHPPLKLLKKQKSKPSKAKIYRSLYNKEKHRLTAALK